jgi:hypothetical protein
MSIHQRLEGFPSGENDAHSDKGQVCSGPLTVNDLTRAGSRHFRLKAFFVSGANIGVEWAKQKGGVAWSPGHVCDAPCAG